jgi:hypothetical protein
MQYLLEMVASNLCGPSFAGVDLEHFRQGPQDLSCGIVAAVLLENRLVLLQYRCRQFAFVMKTVRCPRRCLIVQFSPGAISLYAMGSAVPEYDPDTEFA